MGRICNLVKHSIFPSPPRFSLFLDKATCVTCILCRLNYRRTINSHLLKGPANPRAKRQYWLTCQRWMLTHWWQGSQIQIWLRIWTSELSNWILLERALKAFENTLNYKKVFGRLIGRALKAYENLFWNLQEFVVVFLRVWDLFGNLERHERSNIRLLQKIIDNKVLIWSVDVRFALNHIKLMVLSSLIFLIWFISQSFDFSNLFLFS